MPIGGSLAAVLSLDSLAYLPCVTLLLLAVKAVQ